MIIHVFSIINNSELLARSYKLKSDDLEVTDTQEFRQKIDQKITEVGSFFTVKNGKNIKVVVTNKNADCSVQFTLIYDAKNTNWLFVKNTEILNERVTCYAINNNRRIYMKRNGELKISKTEETNN